MKDVRYRYIRNPETHFPAVCIAYTIDVNKLNFGYSISNPNDIYNKNLARTIAKGRLDKNHYSIILSRNPNYLDNSIILELIEKMIVCLCLPKRITNMFSKILLANTSEQLDDVCPETKRL